MLIMESFILLFPIKGDILSSVSLCEFEMERTGTYSFRVIDSEGDRILRFDMPPGYVPDNDLIAIGISTLLGHKYSSVSMDFSISEQAKAKLAGLVGATVKADIAGKYMSPPLGSKIALNFSGGFDSLAAKTLLPEEACLVAIDFGGSFDRERVFFEKFDPFVISTNFREEGFAGNTWAFMGIGPIILRDFLGIDTYSFGSILEATPFNFSPKLRFNGSADPWMEAVGLRKLNPVLGLTEVGTAMLLNRFAPELVKGSLVSLAAPESEKFTRKVVLQALAEKAVGHRSRSALFDVSRSRPHRSFGQVFLSDFLSLYILKKGGEQVNEWLVGDIPHDVKRAVQRMDLNFYERLNTNFYGNFSTADSQRLYSRCLHAGIIPYDENDWYELGEVVRILARYHEIPGMESYPMSASVN